MGPVALHAGPLDFPAPKEVPLAFPQAKELIHALFRMERV